MFIIVALNLNLVLQLQVMYKSGNLKNLVCSLMFNFVTNFLVSFLWVLGVMLSISEELYLSEPDLLEGNPLGNLHFSLCNLACMQSLFNTFCLYFVVDKRIQQ